MTLKNVPEELVERLRASAQENRRSLNGEILSRLEGSFRGGRMRTVEELQAEIRAAHQRMSYVKPTTTRQIVAWIRKDRDRP